MPNDTRARLEEIFRAVFNAPAAVDVTVAQQKKTPEWDSLAHVMIVTAIESEFGITLDADEQLRMTSFEATAALLTERGL